VSKTFTLQAIRNAAAKRPAGYVADVLSRGTVEGDRVTLSDEAYADLVAQYRPPPPPPGPGTELKALLKKVGIVASPNCSCNARAKMMDENESKEPGWCEKNIETIIDWLQDEASKRGLPFLRTAGKILIRKAISNYKKKL
jgi:hypothetical protein